MDGPTVLTLVNQQSIALLRQFLLRVIGWPFLSAKKGFVSFLFYSETINYTNSNQLPMPHCKHSSQLMKSIKTFCQYISKSSQYYATIRLIKCWLDVLKRSLHTIVMLHWFARSPNVFVGLILWSLKIVSHSIYFSPTWELLTFTCLNQPNDWRCGWVCLMPAAKWLVHTLKNLWYRLLKRWVLRFEDGLIDKLILLQNCHSSKHPKVRMYAQ